jgi:hypothetical protein
MSNQNSNKPELERGENPVFIFTIKSKKHGSLDALVDRDKRSLISEFTWSVTKQGNTFYAISSLWDKALKKSKFIYLHRLITEFKFPLVDHVNRNGLDNRLQNLRNSTRALNSINSVRKRKLPTGVYLTPTGRFTSRYVRDGVTVIVGTFDTVSGAYEARQRELPWKE